MLSGIFFYTSQALKSQVDKLNVLTLENAQLRLENAELLNTYVFPSTTTGGGAGGGAGGGE